MQRMRVEKGGSFAGGLSDLDKMVAYKEQRALIEQATPKVSSAMSGARRASLAFLEGEKLSQAQTLMEFIEQSPIFSKRQSLERIKSGEFVKDLNILADAFTGVNKDMGAVHGSLTNLLGGDKAMGMLSEDMMIQNPEAVLSAYGMENTQANRSMVSNIKGMDIKGTLSDMSWAQDQAKISPEAVRYIETMEGGLRRKGVSGQRIAQELVETFAGGQMPKNMSKFSTAALASSNILTSLGETGINNYKPLALGFAASIGIASIFSSPGSTLGAGNRPDVEMDMHQGKSFIRQGAETVTAGAGAAMGGVASVISGSPEDPQALMPPSAMIAPPGAEAVTITCTF